MHLKPSQIKVGATDAFCREALSLLQQFLLRCLLFYCLLLLTYFHFTSAPLDLEKWLELRSIPLKMHYSTPSKALSTEYCCKSTANTTEQHSLNIQLTFGLNYENENFGILEYSENIPHHNIVFVINLQKITIMILLYTALVSDGNTRALLQPTYYDTE